MSNVVEKLLPVDVAPGQAGGPGFMTQVKKLRGGAEFRNRLWTDPLRSYSTRYNHKEQSWLVDELHSFVYEVGGSHLAFRARDWSDYLAEDEQVAVADGETWWFRLYRRYGAYERRIIKPRPATVTVYVDGYEVDRNAYVVDGVNGTIIFGHPPPEGSLITWSGEFHVPVRFEDDVLDVVMTTAARGTVSPFGLLEVRTKESINGTDYADVRDFIRAYDGGSWSNLFDILYRHVNIEWDITQ